MIFLNGNVEKQLGLSEILLACNCRTPQGKRLKLARHFYTPAEKGPLEAEFTAVGALRALYANHESQYREGSLLLSQLREMRATLAGLDQERLLDEVELFEIKRGAAIFRQLSRLDRLCAAGAVNFNPLPEIEKLLDPGGTGNPGFYIYSEYSKKLSALRKQKTALENRIAESEGDERSQLLKERSLVHAEEDAEEERVRRELSTSLRTFAPGLRANYDACGILDFRMARAELAQEWKACQPEICPDRKDAKIVGAWQPQVLAALKKSGQGFTGQSIVIKPGTTIISGPNMGGKSVALQAIFLALVLPQLAYFSPAQTVCTPLYDFFSFTSDQSANNLQGLSSFGMEITEIRNNLRRAKGKRGLIVMDEPCRGTNPREASVILQVLCETYAKHNTSFMIATHYRIRPAEGIHYYQIKGIRQEALCQYTAKAGTPDADIIRSIQTLMDYHLEKVDGEKNPPFAAIQVAELLGLDPSLIQQMRELWEEESWQN